MEGLQQFCAVSIHFIDFTIFTNCKVTYVFMARVHRVYQIVTEHKKITATLTFHEVYKFSELSSVCSIFPISHQIWKVAKCSQDVVKMDKCDEKILDKVNRIDRLAILYRIIYAKNRVNQL